MNIKILLTSLIVFFAASITFGQSLDSPCPLDIYNQSCHGIDSNLASFNKIHLTTVIENVEKSFYFKTKPNNVKKTHTFFAEVRGDNTVQLKTVQLKYYNYGTSQWEIVNGYNPNGASQLYKYDSSLEISYWDEAATDWSDSPPTQQAQQTQQPLQTLQTLQTKCTTELVNMPTEQYLKKFPPGSGVCVDLLNEASSIYYDPNTNVKHFINNEGYSYKINNGNEGCQHQNGTTGVIAVLGDIIGFSYSSSAKGYCFQLSENTLNQLAIFDGNLYKENNLPFLITNESCNFNKNGELIPGLVGKIINGVNINKYTCINF